MLTLPKTTPLLEAERLQADLQRAGIEPFAWVANQSLAAAHIAHPILAERARGEFPLIERVVSELATRVAAVPMLTESPAGAERLRKTARGADHVEKSHV